MSNDREYIEIDAVRKIYVFMTTSVSRVGGAEIYMSSKTRWLEREGWTVLIAAPLSADCPVSYGNATLVNFRLYSLRPACVSKKLRYKAVRPLINIIQKYPKVVIESATIPCGMWGEFVARLVKGHHLIFHLCENVPPLSYGDKIFLRHKNEVNELAFISAKIGEMALGSENGTKVQCSVLRAYQGEVIQRIPYEGSICFEDGIRIGSISRLDKPYIPLVAEGVRWLAERRKENHFQLIFIGDALDPAIKKRLEAQSCDNLSITVVDSMYPLPRVLLESFDVFVAKAGSATALRRHGFPTIQFSLTKDICIGIAGVDFENPTSAVERNLTDVLSDYLFGDRYQSCDPRYGVSPSKEPDYSDHLNFLFQGKPYCAFDQVSSSEELLWERFKGAFVSVFGIDRYIRLRPMYLRLRSKLHRR